MSGVRKLVVGPITQGKLKGKALSNALAALQKATGQGIVKGK